MCEILFLKSENNSFFTEIYMITNKQLSQEEYFLRAAGRGDFTTVEAMARQQEVDIDCQDELGTTALIRSAERGDIRMTSYLLEMGANPNKKAHATGETPLLNATENNHLKVIEKLIDNGAHIDEADNYGKTPLLAAILTNNSTLAHRFINEGADLNKQNIWGQTALHLSIQKNKEELTKFLLDQKIDVNIPDEKGETPLHLAVRSKDIKTTALLIDYGANLNSPTLDGRTPLDLAVQNKDAKMFEFLTRLGAETTKVSLTVKNELKQTPSYQMQYILNQKETSVDKNKDAIFNAVKTNDIAYLEENLNNSFININQQNKEGKTPLMVAAELGNFAAFISLFAHGADRNAKDAEGHTVKDILLQSAQTSETKEMLYLLNKAPVAVQRAQILSKNFIKEERSR